MALQNTELLVVEYSGTARSGKGSVVAHLGKRSRIATDETGADYRALTKSLLVEGVIEEGMTHKIIEQRLKQILPEKLVALAAARKDIVESYGFDSLYTSDINALVAEVAPIIEVRKAIKEGLKERIRRVRDSGEYDVLAVDGRHLGPVIETVEGTRLFLRTFVTAHPIESALRECARRGIDLQSAEGQRILADITRRNEMDALRANDPVRPEQDALYFTHDKELREAALNWYADTIFGGDMDQARNVMHDTLVRPPGAEVDHHQIGRTAALSGRQIWCDTTAFRGYEGAADPREKMLEEFESMFDDAREAVENLALV